MSMIVEVRRPLLQQKKGACWFLEAGRMNPTPIEIHLIGSVRAGVLTAQNLA